jgi:hypothetical protein
MFRKLLVAGVAAGALVFPTFPPGPAVAVDHGVLAAGVPIVDENGEIPGFTYGKNVSNDYNYWSGGFLWRYTFAMHHIGFSPATPKAGTPFYLHAHVAVVAAHDRTGNVLIAIDQDAGGLPIRLAASSAMPLRCSRSQFYPEPRPPVEIPCRTTVSVESGYFVVSRLEPLVPGLQLEIEVPVVVDHATSGTAAMQVMWASQYLPDPRTVYPSVPITVAAKPVAGTYKVPKKLRNYAKVRSLTPSVCKVKTVGAKRVVKVSKHGLCKLRGTKSPGGRTKTVRIRY